MSRFLELLSLSFSRYQDGCFLFDIFLGPNYNQAPPSVKFMTDGKVCLSLLGTWSGPGWVSGKSTLLQVLISIQSMIPCEEPYLNEPGWANDGGTPQSRQCEWLNSMIITFPDFLLDSFNVWRMVVKTAVRTMSVIPYL
ncbi:ubiquitin-conjugating enzyme/RWD-like protein [Suillus spraguei]|nr:ubiquitin-conjugating enzyme/RWD-like protein [Suillus spraguei]